MIIARNDIEILSDEDLEIVGNWVEEIRRERFQNFLKKLATMNPSEISDLIEEARKKLPPKPEPPEEQVYEDDKS